MPRDKAPQAEVKKQVREYFAALAPDVRATLKRLEKMVHAAAPRAEQGFTYRMPCVRIDDRPVVWYAGFKGHVSLFPMTAPIVRAHAAARLSAFKVPRHLALVAEIPKGPTGKLQRSGLAERLGLGLPIGDEQDHSPARTALEARLCALWAELLKIGAPASSINAELIVEPSASRT